jgi:hypothetical protein
LKTEFEVDLDALIRDRLVDTSNEEECVKESERKLEWLEQIKAKVELILEI